MKENTEWWSRYKNKKLNTMVYIAPGQGIGAGIRLTLINITLETDMVTKNLNNRIKELRENLINTKAAICPERAEIVTSSYRDHSSEPINILRAKTLERILKDMSIYILPNELIVGNHSSRLKAAPVFPEFDVKFLENELNDFGNRSGDPFNIDEESKRRIKKIIPFWKGKTIKEYNISMWPEDNKLSSQGYVGVIDNEWSLENSDGHVCVDYPLVLNLGLEHIIQEADNYIEKLDISDPEDLKKIYFYKSVKITAKAVIDFSLRFSKLAQLQADNEKNLDRKKELERVSKICKNVPAKPARNLYEALQSLWFIHLCIQIDGNGHSISIGRFDKFMYPFYRKEIDSNSGSKEEILELIQCFWIKLASVNKLRCWSQTRLNAGYPLFQNLTIGGQSEFGDDESNELSYICLDVTESLKLTQPTLTARIHKRTPREFIQRCSELIMQGLTVPSFFNDEVIIDALRNRGVSVKDAYDYCLIGCVEPSVQGKWGGRYGASQFNLSKCLELALYGGKDPRTGIRLCPDNRNLSNYKSYEELFSSFVKQLNYFIRQHVIRENIQDYVWEKYFPTPLISCLILDCMKRGKEIKEGGAVYDYTGGQTGNIANVANSLAAVKKLVFEEKKITGPDLMKVLKNDFEGLDGEKVRQMLINRAPKYGNDDDYVDNIAIEVFSILMNEVTKYKNTRFGKGPIGGRFHHSTASVAANIPFGLIIGATPDGRKKYTPVADTESPSHGTELNGPTAVLKSVAKLPHIYESGGSILNIKFNQGIFQDRENLEKLIDMIYSYIDINGMELQINVISADKLRKAQKDPEKYKDLLIRVAGYSAYFVDLDPLVQNDIIDRTEYII